MLVYVYVVAYYSGKTLHVVVVNNIDILARRLNNRHFESVACVLACQKTGGNKHEY